MLLDEFTFLLPPKAPQESELPEAFDRALQNHEAQREGNIVRRALQRAKRRTAPKDARSLLAQFLQELKIERGLSAPALKVYEKDLQIYLAWLQAKSVSLRDVSEEQLENFKRDLQGGQIHKIRGTQKRPAQNATFYAAPTLARKLAVVRDWHRFLAREYHWPNPAAFLEIAALSIAPTPTRAHLVVSIGQMQALLRAPSRSQAMGKRDRAILYLLCEGLSASEIISLRYDAEFTALGAASGALVLSEGAQAVLHEYSNGARPILMEKLKQKRRYSRHLFFSNRGTPLSATMIQQIVKRHAKTAQLPIWVSPATLARSGTLRRGGREAITALPRATHLRHAYEKAHPRA